MTNFLDQAFLNNFFWPDYSCTKIFWTQHFLGPNIFLYSNFFLDTTVFFYPNCFWTPISIRSKMFEPQILWTQYRFGTRIFLDSTNFLVPTIFRPQLFVDPQLDFPLGWQVSACNVSSTQLVSLSVALLVQLVEQYKFRSHALLYEFS